MLSFSNEVDPFFSTAHIYFSNIFLGYSTTSRAYKVFNKRIKTVMESINVKIDDALTKVEMSDDGEGPSTKEPDVEVEALDIKVEGSTSVEESTP